MNRRLKQLPPDSLSKYEEVVVDDSAPDYLDDIRRAIMRRDEKLITPLLRMLRESDHAIQKEINATADDEHPAMKRKIKLLEKHERQLKKMGLI